VAELVQDGQSVFPCLAGSGRVANGVIGLTEAGEGTSLTIAVAEIPVYVEA
jgi:hypothetical protein